MKSITLIATLLGVLALSTAANVPSDVATSAEATATTTSNLDFASALRLFTDAFQRIMPCGYAPDDIPIYAPLSVDHYAFNVEVNEYLKLNGSVSNLILTGMNKYRWLNLAYDAATQRTTFDIDYSQLQVLGEYDMDFWALMAGFPVSMPGAGLINFKVTDMRFVGEFTLTTSPQNPEGLAITDFHMNVFLGDVAPNGWNTYWNAALNNFMNRWTREYILMMTEQMQPLVDQLYNNVVLPMVNDSLENVSMQQLIDFFTQTASVWNKASCNVA